MKKDNIRLLVMLAPALVYSAFMFYNMTYDMLCSSPNLTTYSSLHCVTYNQNSFNNLLLGLIGWPMAIGATFGMFIIFGEEKDGSG